MKAVSTILKTAAALVLAASILVWFPCAARAERTVTVGYYDYKPLVFKDQNGEPAGLYIDVLNHLARKEGWRISYRYGTWKETYEGLKEGHLDLVPCIGVTDERRKLVDFSSDYLFLDWGVIYSLSGSGIENILDLKGKRVAIVAGSVLIDGLRNTLRQFEISPSFLEDKSYQEVFRDVVERRAHAGVVPSLVGLQLDHQFSVRRTPIVFSPIRFAYAVKRGQSADLLRALDHEIAVLKADKNSYYYQRYEYWITNLQRRDIPKAFWYTLAALLVSGSFLAFWAVLLKRQVRVKTEFLEEEIRQRKQKEAELNDKNAELERFTYTVSHDLKSPLITIKGYVGALQEDLRNGNYPRMTSDLQRIGRAADTMNRLLQDLLELSRIGRVITPPRPVCLHQLVPEVLAQLAGLLRDSGVKVIVQDDLPTVMCDPQRIAEVFQNLIENAVKYGRDQPAPLIVIGMREAEGTPVFFVKDNGMGIDSEYHETIFGIFDQLDAKSDGAGIGLALVKRIIEVHGGSIWVESEGLGAGSTFCFTLPSCHPDGRDKFSTAS